MGTKVKALFSLIGIFCASLQVAQADVATQTEKIKGKKVKLVGEVKDESLALSHTDKHWHELVFIEKATGKEYDVVESEEIKKLHCETEKNYLVEIEGELTPRVLFWGNNLVIKKFRVLASTSESIPHQKSPEHRGGRNGRN